VGHDLHPLAALRVAVDALAGAALSPAHRAEPLRTIADGADRLDGSITNPLLEPARDRS
jgi:K+-sensing histidine kinase KdpD